jgi:hypothetical protein
LKLNLKSKSGELGNQAPGLAFGGTAIEVIGAEVVVFGAVFEDVVDGREDRGGDGTNCFLRSAPGLQPEELGFVIAVLLPNGAGQLIYKTTRRANQPACLRNWKSEGGSHERTFQNP